MGERLREEAAGRRGRRGARGDRRAGLARGRAAADRRRGDGRRRRACWRPTVQSLSHTAARKRATEAGARIATLPGVTEEMLARVMSADMEGLRRKGARRRRGARRAPRRRGSPARTAATCASTSTAAQAIPDAGELTEPGAFGNLPCGEGFISPGGRRRARWSIDGSIAGIGLVDEPVELVVEGGHLTSARGGQGMAFMELLTEHGEDGTNIAELGIGTNEKAILTGEILEDEKILGTCHVAFGASAAIGGTVQVPVHLDCVVMKPTVELDGEAIVRDGELLVRERRESRATGPRSASRTSPRAAASG